MSDNNKPSNGAIYSCALRTRSYAGIPQRLEIGIDISNSITTVTKDFLIMDEQIRIRKLTPTECFRLMGFTDEDIKNCRDVGMSNSQLYKQAGNSIVVSVLEAIFGQMVEGKEETWKDNWK